MTSKRVPDLSELRTSARIATAVAGVTAACLLSGTFGPNAVAAQIELNPGSLPGLTERPYPYRTITAADVDGDGREDLLSSEYIADNALVGNTVLAEDGGGFGAPLSAGFLDNQILSATDLDGDGLADLASVYFDSVITQPGSGDGKFGTGGPRAGSPLFGDIDADGDDDVLTDQAQVSPGTGITVFVNDGTGDFAAPLNPQPAEGTLRQPAVGDFDGDGSPDLAACFDASKPGAQGIAVFLGNGSGGFDPADAGDGAGADCDSLAAGDLNADGTDDLVTNQFDVLSSSSNGQLSLVGSVPSGPGPADSVSLADMSGDGRPDAIFEVDGFEIWLGNGSGGFGSAPVLRRDREVDMLRSFELGSDGDTDLVGLTGDRRIPTVWANVSGESPSPPDTAGPGSPFRASRTLPEPVEFESSDPAAELECSLDFGPYGACASVLAEQPADGRHFVAARAVKDGKADPTPAQTAVRIDTVDPSAEVGLVTPGVSRGFPKIRVEGNIGPSEPVIGGTVRVKGEPKAASRLTLLTYSDGFYDTVDEFDTRDLMVGSRASNRGRHEVVVRAVDQARNIARAVRPFRVR